MSDRDAAAVRSQAGVAAPRWTPFPAASAVLGATALLVVLGQLVRLVPPEDLVWIRPLDGLLRAGNVALTALLAGVGFWVTGFFLSAVSQGRGALMRSFAGFVVLRLTLLAGVVGAVAVVASVDGSDTTSSQVTRRSILHVLAFRWNEVIRDQPLSVRGDLTSLWYFSIEMQLVLGAFALVLLLGRRPRAVAVVTVALALLVVGWRIAELDAEGWFSLSLSQLGRADGFLVGAAAGALVGRWRPSPGTAAGVAGGCVLGLVGVLVWCSSMSIDTYFTVGGPVTAVLVSGLMLGLARDPDPRTLLVTATRSAEGRTLGEVWPCLVAVAGPIVALLQRRAEDTPVVFLLALASLGIAGAATACRLLLVTVWRGISTWRHESDAPSAPPEER